MRGAEAEEAKEAEKAKAADAKEAEAEEEPAAAEAEEAGGSAEAEAEAEAPAEEAEAEVEVEAEQGGPKQAVHVLGPLHHGALRYLVITPSHLVSTPSCTTVRSTAVSTPTACYLDITPTRRAQPRQVRRHLQADAQFR